MVVTFGILKLLKLNSAADNRVKFLQVENYVSRRFPLGSRYKNGWTECCILRRTFVNNCIQ
jgi:hypothetical protein